MRAHKNGHWAWVAVAVRGIPPRPRRASALLVAGALLRISWGTGKRVVTLPLDTSRAGGKTRWDPPKWFEGSSEFAKGGGGPSRKRHPQSYGFFYLQGIVRARPPSVLWGKRASLHKTRPQEPYHTLLVGLNLFVCLRASTVMDQQK